MSHGNENCGFSDAELPTSADEGDAATATGGSFLDDTQVDRRTSIASSFLAIPTDGNGDKDDEVVFVKLWLPQGAAYTLTAYKSMTIADLQTKVAAELYIPHQMLILVHAVDFPKLLKNSDDELVKDLISKNNKLELYVNCTDPDIELEVPENLRAKPLDIITVVTNSGVQGLEKSIVVEIENDCREKEFFGGFRCKKTGREFYHASSQTPSAFPTGLKKVKRSRKVQTQLIATFQQQTLANESTQTGGPIEGRQVAARAFEEIVADETLSKYVVLIQRVFRGWRVRRGLQRISQEALSAEELQVYVESREESANGYNPTMFEVLYQLVERWRKRCLQYTFATKTEGPSRADFQDILEMQVNMLAVIERERMKMRAKRQEEKEKRLLDESCSPIKWKTYNGITISMETLKCQRAAKLKELHDKLFAADLDSKELKENLLIVKESMPSQSDPNTQEILKLIDRELQLLEMGVSTKDLKNLHLRLKKVFANLIRDPAECKPVKHKFFLCNQCRKMLPPKSFVIPLTRPELKVCTSCHWIDNMSHKRVDHGPFNQMLKELQQYESRRGCYRSMAFVLEVHDIKLIVSQIWHGQSAISQTSNLQELRLGRWDSSREWSPWNSVLLSKKELQEHLSISELTSVYGEEFIKNVHIKHLIAQIHFKGLQKMK